MVAVIKRELIVSQSGFRMMKLPMQKDDVDKNEAVNSCLINVKELDKTKNLTVCRFTIVAKVVLI